MTDTSGKLEMMIDQDFELIAIGIEKGRRYQETDFFSWGLETEHPPRPEQISAIVEQVRLCKISGVVMDMTWRLIIK